LKPIQELKGLDPLLKDPEMRSLALEEQSILQEEQGDLARKLLQHLLPKDSCDESSAVLEIRAGTGGSEASIFAKELFQMYEQFSRLNHWEWEEASISRSDLGGYREAIATITAPKVFQKLKFESGVHRVQRIPATESQGRIHTSTVTVAVLPLPEELDVEMEIPPEDLRIDVYRASGAGGQVRFLC
jgi:peptide chain release factor 1